MNAKFQLVDRLVDIDSLESWRAHFKGKVVAVNGCFDCFHKGHSNFLSIAKGYGDVLIVGLNSDESVRQLKGPSRPVQNQLVRSQILLEHPAVDFVCVFNEVRAWKFLRYARPDVLCKSEEYRGNLSIDEGLELSPNCEVIFIPRTGGYSTTGVINKLGEQKPI